MTVDLCCNQGELSPSPAECRKWLISFLRNISLTWTLFNCMGLRIGSSTAKQGLRWFPATGFHQEAMSQFLVLNSKHAFMEPISRGAMTFSWPQPTNVLPCTPITGMCIGNLSLLRASEAYSHINFFPPFRAVCETSRSCQHLSSCMMCGCSEMNTIEPQLVFLIGKL